MNFEMIYALLPLVFHYYSILTALIFHYYNIKLSSTTSFLVYLLFSCCCLDYWWCQSRSFNPAQSFYLHHIHFVTYIFYFHPLDSFCIQQNSGSYACKLKESYYLWPQRSSEANLRLLLKDVKVGKSLNKSKDFTSRSHWSHPYHNNLHSTGACRGNDS